MGEKLEKLGGRSWEKPSQARHLCNLERNTMPAYLPMLLGHTLCNIEPLQKVVFNTSAPSTYGFPKASITLC